MWARLSSVKSSNDIALQDVAKAYATTISINSSLAIRLFNLIVVVFPSILISPLKNSLEKPIDSSPTVGFCRCWGMLLKKHPLSVGLFIYHLPLLPKHDIAPGYYLTKASSNPGAGDVLMGFLGFVILSFAFSMFKQRKLVKRHAAEIFTSVIIATIFSMYSTALVGRLVKLEPDLTVSILPRCITVALALSILSLFEGSNSSLTSAVVVVTGLVGANFVLAVLDQLDFRDPIARGIATASSAHGLGTAALSAKEPEALPFCAIVSALTGIVGSLICSLPAVRQSLLAIIG